MAKKTTYSVATVAKYLAEAPKAVTSYITDLEQQIRNLSNIGLALSKEKDMNKLLEMILIEAKRIANSDGGTLYMMTDDQRLRFEIMMTDSLNFHMGGTSGEDIPFYPVKLYTDEGEANKTMIAAYVGLTGDTVNIEDAYTAKGFDFSGTKMFDEKTGYRSQSFLTVPLKNHEDEIIGVLQLLNAQDAKSKKIIPFEPNPLAYRLLMANIAMNGLRDLFDVSYVGLGLSDKAQGGFAMTDQKKNLGAAKMVAGEGDLEVVRGDDALRDINPDLLKIDVEGMEIMVLSGLEETIARAKPRILIEVDQANYDAFDAWVEKVGYQVTDVVQRYRSNKNFFLEPKSD